MSESFTIEPPIPANPDGFRVEIDAARERADIILDRPPLNIIVMPERDQLRKAVATFRAAPRDVACLQAQPDIPVENAKAWELEMHLACHPGTCPCIG